METQSSPNAKAKSGDSLGFPKTLPSPPKAKQSTSSSSGLQGGAGEAPMIIKEGARGRAKSTGPETTLRTSQHITLKSRNYGNSKFATIIRSVKK